MSAAELRRFLVSPEGKAAGLSRGEAKQQGIASGQDSARWILKMLPNGTSFGRAVAHWTPRMWQECRRQVAFISRMRGNSGPLHKDGEMTRKLTSLLLWGHDPEKPLRRVSGC